MQVRYPKQDQESKASLGRVWRTRMFIVRLRINSKWRGVGEEVTLIAYEEDNVLHVCRR